MGKGGADYKRRGGLLALVAGALHCGNGDTPPPRPHAPLPPAVSYADYGDRAATALVGDLYAGAGLWFECDGGCNASNRDWGVDSLTYVLHLRWSLTRDARLVPLFRELVATATVYGPCLGADCTEWSDTPEWDAIADLRELEVTGNPTALVRAKAAYASVSTSDAYARGACPSINYQRPFGGGGGLKTLETDSNLVKAALLLFRATGDGTYLAQAERTYAAVRQLYLDATLPLYTVYVFDDGSACTQVPRRFFASVNGNMIWNGLELAAATGAAGYLADATATAHAVDEQLADGRGVFANLQAENDVAEPLVEAMLRLATEGQADFARAWILKNAEAAIGNARIPDGLYGRFFDGPAPEAGITAWQTNGGLALAVAAASLTPAEAPRAGGDWAHAAATVQDLATLPSSVTFTGSGIAIVGTLGENCCETGHAGVTLDGAETVDRTGIWQNKSSAGELFPNALLFAWRWPAPGPHTVSFGAETENAKEGGPFLHVRRYVVLP